MYFVSYDKCNKLSEDSDQRFSFSKQHDIVINLKKYQIM